MWSFSDIVTEIAKCMIAWDSKDYIMSPFATVESMDTWSKMPFDLKTI